MACANIKKGLLFEVNCFLMNANTIQVFQFKITPENYHLIFPYSVEFLSQCHFNLSRT